MTGAVRVGTGRVIARDSFRAPGSIQTGHGGALQPLRSDGKGRCAWNTERHCSRHRFDSRINQRQETSWARLGCHIFPHDNGTLVFLRISCYLRVVSIDPALTMQRPLRYTWLQPGFGLLSADRSKNRDGAAGGEHGWRYLWRRGHAAADRHQYRVLATLQPTGRPPPPPVRPRRVPTVSPDTASRPPPVLSGRRGGERKAVSPLPAAVSPTAAGGAGAGSHQSQYRCSAVADSRLMFPGLGRPDRRASDRQKCISLGLPAASRFGWAGRARAGKSRGAAGRRRPAVCEAGRSRRAPGRFQGDPVFAGCRPSPPPPPPWKTAANGARRAAALGALAACVTRA